MAIVYANYAIDLNEPSLNTSLSGHTSLDFLSNANTQSPRGNVYEDAVRVGFVDGVEAYAYFGGTGFEIGLGPAGYTVTAGTLTGYWQTISDGTSFVADWGIEGVSVPAVDIYNAAQSDSNVDDIAVLRAALGGADTFNLSAFADLVNGYAGADLMKGNNGNDTLNGGDGNDTMQGGGGGDYLSGANGADALNGGGGNDKLIGGAGKDKLTGGTGNDQFVFNTALSATTNVDTLTDFKAAGSDKLVLDHTIFAALGITSGPLPAGELLVGTGVVVAQDSNDHILYASDTGALFYDRDGDGAAGAIRFATLSTHPTLAAADFLIVP